MKDRKTISILCPTRQRPELAARFADSVMSTAADPDRVEILFYVDIDDPELEEYRMKLMETSAMLVVGNPIRVGASWNVLANKCHGDYMIMGNDDLVARTPGWDDILCKEVSEYDDKIFVAWFDDSINGKKQCAFPIVSRKWVETLGYFTPECFLFFYHDTWLEDLGRRVQRLHYIDSVIFEHQHFSTGMMGRDATTVRNRSKSENKIDKDMFNSKGHIRNADSGKLRQKISTFTLRYKKDSRLEEVLTGKRVALVGPAGYLEGKSMGEHLNGYDVICRVNEVFPFGQEADYGNRTDIIFHSCANGMLKNFKACLDKNEFIKNEIMFIVMPQCSTNSNPENRTANLARLTKEYDMYGHSPGIKFWEDVVSLTGCTPNTGFLAALILLQYDIKELLITGFSFYKEREDNPGIVHSMSYKQFGGNDVKKDEIKLHNQQLQIECLKQYILSKWKDRVVVDSYMNEILDLDHAHVLDLEGLTSLEPEFRCRKDLLDYLYGKKVAIVGPAPYLTSRGLGKEIDKYDVICRVNEVFPFGLEEDYGSRTDIIFHCCGKFSIKNLKKSLGIRRDITQNIKCIICPQVRKMRYRPRVRLSDTVENIKAVEEFDVPFYQVSKSFWTRMNNQIGVRATANTGLLSILLLLEGFDVGSLFITGFDFYAEGLQPHQRHSTAYLKHGGEREINYIKLDPADGQSSVAYQEKQRSFFKDHLLVRYKDRISMDSHLSKLMQVPEDESVQLHEVVYAVYRVLYGEDFIQASIESILPFVTKVFVFWTNSLFGDVKEVEYQGEKIVFPKKLDNVLGKVRELQEKFGDKVELIYDHWGTPDNQVTHLVNDRILPHHSKPDTVMFMEPDLVWHEEQLKKALTQFNGNGSLIAGSRQIELWKSFKFRIPERKRFGAIFYNMRNLKTLPETGKNGAIEKTKILDATVHNCGFCISEKVMLWKHLTGLAFAQTIADSPPNEDWYEEKWKSWDFKKNNKDLEISKGYEKDIPYAEKYNERELPEVLR